MKQLHPKAVWLFFISSASAWSTIFIVAIGVFMGNVMKNIKEFDMGGDNYTSFSFMKWLWIIIPAIIIISYIWAKLSYHFYKYELTDVGFRKEYGVIYKKYVTIPYDRIQNVDIYRGILARILGLSDLNIQTAGSSAVVSRNGYAGGVGAEGRLPGLSKEVAEELRDELVNRTRKSTNQGL